MDYALTPLARSLADAIVTLCTWSTENMAEMVGIFAGRNAVPEQDPEQPPEPMNCRDARHEPAHRQTSARLPLRFLALGRQPPQRFGARIDESNVIDTRASPPEMRAMLDAYLARIGLTQRPDPTAEGLALMQRAHRLAIGFENLDAMLGRPIMLDLPAVWAKLSGRRGGYCFEQNTLFGAMLGELGFVNRPLLARVWLGTDWPGDLGAAPPRTHTLRLVGVGEERWLADAGFGGSYVPPMPLIDGAQAETPDGARHRLTRSGSPGEAKGAWLLERNGPATATDGRTITSDVWAAQYSFDLAEVAPVDLELSNWWTSTKPGTRFTTACVASIVLEDGFASLNGRRLSIHTGGRGEVTDIARPQDWRAVLADLFHIELNVDEIDRLVLF